MRLNVFLARATSLSRRAADAAIAAGRVVINGSKATIGQPVDELHDHVQLDGKLLRLPTEAITILLNKPVGYVVSRAGQGSRTVYELLPAEYQNLRPIGRLDKDSSGLLLLTNDGQLANELTHPSHQKRKVYEVGLGTPLQPLHRQMINDHGLQLDDGLSQLQLERLKEGNDQDWRVSMTEGRNRQIRRTFASLGYTVTSLHRTEFGDYSIGKLPKGRVRKV